VGLAKPVDRSVDGSMAPPYTAKAGRFRIGQEVGSERRIHH